MPDNEMLAASARIGEWRQGTYGAYAIAKCDLPDGSLVTAMLGANVGQPPLDTPFQCRIQQTAKGWKVVSLVFDALPEALADVGGRVFKRVDGRTGWDVLADDELGLASVPIALYENTLWLEQLGDIDDGTPIRFDAARDHRGFKVTRLLAPTANAAFPGSDGSPFDVVAYVPVPWTAASDKSVALMVRKHGAQVTASLWLKADRLRRFGLRALAVADPAVPDEQSFSHAERILQGRDQAARDALVIDRLLVRVRRHADGRWAISELLRPRPVRPPRTPDEIIDWMEGHVDSLRAGKARGDTEAAGNPETTVAKPPMIIVDIRYGRPGFGWEHGALYLTERQCQAAGLAPGVAVVVQLRKSKESQKIWSIKMLHRSTPHVAERSDDA